MTSTSGNLPRARPKSFAAQSSSSSLSDLRLGASQRAIGENEDLHESLLADNQKANSRSSTKQKRASSSNHSNLSHSNSHLSPGSTSTTKQVRRRKTRTASKSGSRNRSRSGSMRRAPAAFPSESAAIPMSSARSHSTSSNGNGSNHCQSESLAFDAEPDPNEIARLVLWRRPLATLRFATLDAFHWLSLLVSRALERKLAVGLALTALALMWYVCAFTFAENEAMDEAKRSAARALYWIALGVASSIGLGTGLHTFLLYLGPFIVRVTIEAYNCGSLDFPNPPYPDRLECPPPDHVSSPVTFWAILRKVQFDAIMWGFGTAIGELPPYFVARASSLISADADGDALNEVRELERLEKAAKITFFQWVKLMLFQLVRRVGFLGILVCASVPNPLFDLAGILCGATGVSFGTFFGATLIGKGLVKANLQACFMILIFSRTLLDWWLALIKSLPAVGEASERFLRAQVESNRNRYRGAAEHPEATGEPAAAAASGASESVVGLVFGWLVSLMLIFFVLSLVNSAAQHAFTKHLRRNRHHSHSCSHPETPHTRHPHSSAHANHRDA